MRAQLINYLWRETFYIYVPDYFQESVESSFVNANIFSVCINLNHFHTSIFHFLITAMLGFMVSSICPARTRISSLDELGCFGKQVRGGKSYPWLKNTNCFICLVSMDMNTYHWAHNQKGSAGEQLTIALRLRFSLRLWKLFEQQLLESSGPFSCWLCHFQASLPKWFDPQRE